MAQDSKKKVFFGGLVDFSKDAVNEVIEQFHDCLSDRSTVPFISYDPANKVFSFTCEQEDTSTIPIFIGNLKEYLENQHNIQLHVAPDLQESPKIRPFEGTTIKDNVILNDLWEEDGQLVSLVDDESESSDDGVRPSGIDSITTYWKPKGRQINILTTNVAQGIAQLTGASLDPEPASKRVRIFGGHYGQALQKLHNLEPLLELIASQRSFLSHKASGNVLMLRRDQQDAQTVFRRIQTEEHVAQRVLVDEQAQAFLDQKCVEELRTYQGGKWKRPENLVGGDLEKTVDTDNSTIWSSFSYPQLGDNTKAQPGLMLAVVSPPPSVASVGGPKSAVSKFLSAKDALNIKEWTQQINEEGDPAAAPDIPQEDAAEQPRTRRKVAVDSDDEDEEEDVTTAQMAKPDHEVKLVDIAKEIVLTTPTRIPQVAASDNSSEEPTSRQTRYVPAPESDDEAEDSSEEPTSRQTRYIPAPESDDEAKDELTRVYTSQPILHGLIEDAIGYQTGKQPTTDPPEQIPASNRATSGFVTNAMTVNQKYRSWESFADFERSDAFADYSAMDTIHRERGRPAEMPSAPPVARNPDTDVVALDTEPFQSAPAWSTPQSVSAVQPVDGARGSHPSTDSSPASPWKLSTEVPVAAGFDPSRYRTQPRGSKHTAKGRSDHKVAANKRGRGDNHSTRGQVSVVPEGQQSMQASSTVPAARSRALDYQLRVRGQDRGRGSRHSNRGDLVDINTSVQSRARMMPPPGLGLRMSSDEQSSAFPETLNFLDGPNEEIQRPALKPAAAYGMRPSVTSSVSSRSPASERLSSGSGGPSYVNHSNPGVQIATIENEQLAYLRQLQDQAQANDPADTKKHKKQSTSQSTTQRMQSESEISTRKYHHTMGQKAPKPATKKQQPQKQETKKERAERIARAKNEAFGRGTAGLRDGGKPESNSTPVKAQPLPSESKQATDAFSGLVTEEQTKRVLTALKPVLEAGRAFCGTLCLEVQLGRILIPSVQSIDKNVLHSAKVWNKLFNPESGYPLMTSSFTNILTTNGADVDRLLEMTLGRGVKLWDKSTPGHATVTYEFHCQSKDNEEFRLVIDQHGSICTQRAPSTVGSVALHYPGQVWDAVAILHGSMKATVSPELEAAVSAFVDSLYVKPLRDVIEIYYRLPTGNEITIRNLVLKRVSRHDCLTENRRQFQLQITEVKTLYHRFHPRDRKLGQGFAKSWEEMVQDNKIHYEACVHHAPSNATLAQNALLELGELTDGTTTGKSLIDAVALNALLELTSLLLSKMDWMGYHNFGTLQRLGSNHNANDIERQQSLAPIGSRLGSPTVYRAARNTSPQTFDLSTYGSAADGANRVPYVPGIRMNTTAEIFLEEGQWKRLGMGGAKIPIPAGQLVEMGLRISEEGEEQIDADELKPDDSMSVVGMQKQQNLGHTRIRSAYTQQLADQRRGGYAGYGSPSRGGSSGGNRSGNDKPAGFW